MHTCVKYICIYMYLYKHEHIHTYIHTYIYIYIRIYVYKTPTSFQSPKKKNAPLRASVSGPSKKKNRGETHFLNLRCHFSPQFPPIVF